MNQILAALVGGNVVVEEGEEKVKATAGGMFAQLTYLALGGVLGFCI